MSSSARLLAAAAALLCCIGAHPATDWSTTRKLDILMIAFPASGHFNPIARLAKKLAARGHNLTVFVGADATHASKYKKLLPDSGHFRWFEFELFEQIIEIMSQVQQGKGFQKFQNMRAMFVQHSEHIVRNLNKSFSIDRFDIVIATEFVMVPLLCINFRWSVPVVLMGTTMPILIDYPRWPWPGLLMGESSDNMTFLQRLISTGETLVSFFFVRFFLIPQLPMLQSFCPSLTSNKLYGAPGMLLPHLVPTVIGFEFPRTSMPLTSYIGPSIPDDPPALSQDPDLELWLNNKTEKTVVYLSMGSVASLDNNGARSLVEGVMKTKYYLLWSLRKNNQEVLRGINIDRERVFISEWTPQFSVLASKAIHSAILHGGLNGLSEALWNKVPIIAYPQMAEQKLNTGRLYHNKLGIRLDKGTLTATKVTEAIEEIERGNYRTNLKKLKKMFLLAGGLDRAADLIEFYGEEGYDHLIPAYVKYQWTWVQYYNMDVWLLFAGISGLLLYAVLKLVKCLSSCCFSRYSKVKKE